MTTETVPTPTDTDERPTKRVDGLQPGDWISAAFTDTDTGDPAEVLSVHPHSEWTLVVYTTAQGEPVSKRWKSSRPVDIARAGEVDRLRERRAQWRIADQLNELAAMVLDLKLPLSIEHGQVRITNGLAGIAEVAELGQRLDITVEVDSVGRNSVYWPRAAKSFQPGVVVEWFAYDPDFKKPEAADPDHGRTTAVAEAKPDTLMVPHGEAHRTAETFTRYFSFGHGQTDPATGESLRDKYVTVIAPTADGCREAMLASRFGREWSFEYVPGRPKTDEWIPRWTEHERIVVDLDGGCE